MAIQHQTRSLDSEPRAWSRWTSWRKLALVQAAFYVVTGVWPIVHIRSFERVTGPKRDKWLVRTVGVLVTAIGGSLLLASRRDRPTGEIRFVAISSALGLAAIDFAYALPRRISRIYLLDAFVEIVLAVLWLRSDSSDGPNVQDQSQIDTGAS
jgi:hypothetical protein